MSGRKPAGYRVNVRDSNPHPKREGSQHWWHPTCRFYENKNMLLISRSCMLVISICIWSSEWGTESRCVCLVCYRNCPLTLWVLAPVGTIKTPKVVWMEASCEMLHQPMPTLLYKSVRAACLHCGDCLPHRGNEVGSRRQVPYILKNKMVEGGGGRFV